MSLLIYSRIYFVFIDDSVLNP